MKVRQTSPQRRAARAQDAGGAGNVRQRGGRQTGVASTYGKGDKFEGRTTANGETFRTNTRETRRINGVDTPVFTAAHKSLPFGTLVRVTHRTKSGEERSVIARINDRGPYAHGRIIDLNFAAAQAVGIGDGLGRVTIENIGTIRDRQSHLPDRMYAGEGRPNGERPVRVAVAPLPPRRPTGIDT